MYLRDGERDIESSFYSETWMRLEPGPYRVHALINYAIDVIERECVNKEEREKKKEVEREREKRDLTVLCSASRDNVQNFFTEFCKALHFNLMQLMPFKLISLEENVKRQYRKRIL